MKVLSMTGFKKFCERIAPASFIFDTENQVDGADRDAKLTMTYSDVIFALNPNRICFKNDNGTLCLNRVKTIKYFNKQNNVGNFFSITCGNIDDSDEDTSYVIIIDQK